MPKRGPGRPRKSWFQKMITWCKKNKWVVLISLTLLVLGGNILLWRHGLSRLKSAFAQGYSLSKDTTAAEVEQKFYDEAYKYYESKYHTRDEMTISVDSLRNESKLEILQVSDVKYVIENEDNNDEHLTAWLKVPGHSVFTVDLSLAEFIVDSERELVTVRLPKPELGNFTIDYDAVEILKFKDGYLNESNKYGAALARRQLATAGEEMRADFSVNQMYIESAKTSAEKILVQLIQEINPGLPSDHIYIEFDG